MLVLKQLPVVVLFAVLFAVLGGLAPSQVAARAASKPREDAKKGCIVHKDGTKDCTPIFIEVGEPVQGVMATCSGYGCDGQDPYGAGCAVSYGVIDMRYIYAGSQQIGYVQLWWSNTCQTNWARTVRTVAGSYLETIVARDNNSNRLWDANDSFCKGTTSTNSAVHSAMVYAPTLKAAAYGLIDSNGGRYIAETGWN